MPYYARGNLHIYCEEELDVTVAGSRKNKSTVIHEVGEPGRSTLTCEKVWSYENLLVESSTPLTLDLSALPEGQPGRTKDLATDQAVNLMYMENFSDNDLLVQWLAPNMQPIAGIGLPLGGQNLLAIYEEDGEALISNFVAGYQISTLNGETDSLIEIMLGTVKTV